MLKDSAYVPVKFTDSGMPYVDPSVSAIPPKKLAEMVRVKMSDQRADFLDKLATCLNATDNTKLETQGYVILRNVIPKHAIDAAVRLIHKDLFDYGISSREIVWWRDNACWFPHLRGDYRILMLSDSFSEYFSTDGMCEPQILLAPPAESKEYEIEPHIDEPPAWAGQRQYRTIVGVPLTPHNEKQGGVQVWPFDGEPVIPELEPCDVLVMHPKLPHCGVPNLNGGVRMAVYFRFLEV